MKRLYAILILSLFTSNLVFIFPAEAQETRPCDQCGMTIDAIGQVRFNIVDVNNTRHYACCPVCALKLIKTYGDLNITAFCDYNGPSYPITINAKGYGSEVSVSPTSALIILGGGCAKNRIVYNATAADLLLAPPNNGASSWLSPLTNATVLPNATRIGVAQAALQYGGGVPSPSPSAASTPTPTSTTGFVFDITSYAIIGVAVVAAIVVVAAVLLKKRK